MIKIIYFDERELVVRREIETKAPKSKSPKYYPRSSSLVWCYLFRTMWLWWFRKQSIL